MHTIPPSFFPFYPRSARAAWGRSALPVMLLAALGLVLLTLGSGPAHAQSFPGAPDSSIGTNLRVYPLVLWSPRVGPGVGLGGVAHNLGRQHGRLLLTAAPARYEQVATISYASANPSTARRYVLLDARGLHTDRDWFYGSGPAAADTGRVTLGRSALSIGLRVGQRVEGTPLTLQPEAKLSLHRLDAGSAASEERSAALPPLGQTQTGVRVGLSAAFDARSGSFPGETGLLLQGAAHRYLPLAGPAPTFDQFRGSAYGSVSLGGPHRLVARLSGTLTAPRSTGAVPYFLLPSVEGALVPGWARDRFVGRDRLMGSLLYRFPVAHFGDVVSLQGYVGGHVASVYDDLETQFEAAVSFEKDLGSGRDTYPLRPSASAGVRLGLPFRNDEWLDLALGLSPEGLTAVRVTFARPIWDLRPIHHGPPRHP